MLGYPLKEWELNNYSELEGNRTAQALYAAYFEMMELEGHEEMEWQELSAAKIKDTITDFFSSQGISTSILDFNAELDGKAFEQQTSYQLWHLLHSYEGDNSNSGNDKLYELLLKKFGFKKEFAQVLANVSFSNDYGSLSAKSMRKIFTFIKEQKYSDACAAAGYNHSSFITREENDKRPLKDALTLLPKNSLRNPVVEKILNQMVNVVNAIIADPSLGKPDEIRIELARELKKSTKEREEMTAGINKSNLEHERIRTMLIREDGIKNPTRNDIIRYKLYEELKINGYKTLYSNTYIPREKLFSKEFDVEHIIPKAKLFDDSFSNKTLEMRDVNLRKADLTAYEFVNKHYGGDTLKEYEGRIDMMYKAKEGPIGKAKYKKLLMKAEEIGHGFIERDLRDTQYIAKKAKQMLHEICRNVISTSGSVTDKLREDWDLVNVMQELNFDKYKKQGLTELVEQKDGNFKERIKDWSKRNDHRHHAMDALTVAFTRYSHIQYLNNLNARKDEHNKRHHTINGIEQKETYTVKDNAGNSKRKFNLPMPHFRAEAKKHLENVLVSFKAKNKVVTKNKNKFKTGNGTKSKTELTPRGQLHKETVYGKLRQYAVKEEKISARFDEATIMKVANRKHRNALLERLRENNNDPKKAFTGKNSPDKNPVYIDVQNSVKLPEKVKLVSLEDDYTIRKDVTPDLKIEKVIDAGVRNILQKRLEAFNNNAKEAFSNLDKNPIWLNEAKGIAIKRVTISGVKNAEALHYKKDHLGKELMDKNGNRIPVDFVSTGNNHHVAIYRDADGNLQESVISFYEAVERVNQGLPVIDKTCNQELGWQFLFTMKQNEYFVFPDNKFDPTEIDLFDPANNRLISPQLFRVQSLSIVKYGNNTIREFKFRHHLETTVEDKKELQHITFKQIKRLQPLEKIIKVRINHIGQIVKVGEY